MALYLDSAQRDEIETARHYTFLSGVTCNPILVSKAMGSNRVKEEQFLDFISGFAEVVSHPLTEEALHDFKNALEIQKTDNRNTNCLLSSDI